jgi:hypothetical protein
MNSFQDVSSYDTAFGASPDGLGATLRVLGDDAPPLMVQPAPPSATIQPNPALQTLKVVYGLASVIGTGIGAYHGYKRNESVGWAIGWALLGGLFPVVVIPVAFAQGIGERK